MMLITKYIHLRDSICSIQVHLVIPLDSFAPVVAMFLAVVKNHTQFLLLVRLERTASVQY